LLEGVDERLLDFLLGQLVVVLAGFGDQVQQALARLAVPAGVLLEAVA
jgi:hypothetical protein